MKSWIEYHILSCLISSASVSLKDIRPESVEPNLFSYHLNKLVTDGLIIRTGRGAYTLSTAGEALVSNMGMDASNVNKNLKSVVMLYSRRGDQYLLYEWKRQPYLGKVTPIFDRFHRGDTLSDALDRATADKLNRTDIRPQFLASGIVRIYKENELVSHMSCYVYSVDELADKDIVTKNGKCFWANIDEVSNSMGGLWELYEQIESSSSSPFDCILTY